MSNEKVYFLVGGSESTFPVDMTDIQQDFVRQIQGYFPQNPVQWAGLREVREGLFGKVGEAMKAFPNAVVVSLSSLYYPTGEHEISVNRVISTSKGSLGLSNRPNSLPLHQQVDNVMAKVGNRPVVTVDDTLFHGDTLSLLMRLGMRIDAAVEYFTKAETVEALRKTGISIYTVVNHEDYVDVMPIHDFLPPLPLCGKVIGYMGNEGPEPLVIDGLSFSVPYLMPWLTPAKVFDWSSVPESNAVEFSVFAIRQSIEVMKRLWGHGFSSLDYAVKYQPLRTSVPFFDGHEPDMKVCISVMLERYLHLVEEEI